MPFSTNKGPVTLSTSMIDFFQEHITIQDNAFLFLFDNTNGYIKETEYWSIDRHLVPTSSGTWLVSHGFPIQIRHLFLSHSAADIFCFCQYQPDWLKVCDNIAFAALGLVASKAQIIFLKDRFVNAKIHTLFDAGITGRVTDCKVALWMKGKDATFKVDSGQIAVFYNRNEITIPIEAFSLNRFEKKVALRTGIRTHKPKGSFNSYYDLFISAK